MNYSNAEDIYRELGQYVFDNAGDGWKLAWIAAEIEHDDAGRTYARFKKTLGPTQDIDTLDTDSTVYDLFNRLREVIKHPDHSPFTSAVFTIDWEGAFDIDLGYEKLEGYSWQRSKALSKEKGAQTGVRNAS